MTPKNPPSDRPPDPDSGKFRWRMTDLLFLVAVVALGLRLGAPLVESIWLAPAPRAVSQIRFVPKDHGQPGHSPETAAVASIQAYLRSPQANVDLLSDPLASAFTPSPTPFDLSRIRIGHVPRTNYLQFDLTVEDARDTRVLNSVVTSALAHLGGDWQINYQASPPSRATIRRRATLPALYALYVVLLSLIGLAAIRGFRSWTRRILSDAGRRES